MSNENTTNNPKKEVHRSRRAKKAQEALAAEEAAKQLEQTEGAGTGEAQAPSDDKKKKKKRKKKKKSVIWLILKILVLLVLIAVIGVGAYVAKWAYGIMMDAPPIDTSDIDSLLSQSSTLYDADGNQIDSIFGDKDRTLVDINDVPKHVKNAFVALEDKTFWSHHGFNFVRMAGAVKEALTSGGGISGTSTLTQQLARNLYLEDIMAERSINRKLIEAYYAYTLETNLSKDEILEAYLNCVNFGGVYGIQTAAQAYFSKDVKDLTVAEAAALAAIPQQPTTFRLVKQVSVYDVTEDTENLITKNEDYAYLWNDACSGRMQTCINLMHEQGYISDAQYNKAKKTKVKDIVNPTVEKLESTSNYFADYVIKTVINDFMKQYGYSYEKAYNLVYNGGIEIHTTLNPQAQAIVEQEFDNPANFPQPTGYVKDAKGNIKNPNGGTLLYAFRNYIEEDGTFRLQPEEFQKNDNGSVTIFKGGRLAVYNTTVNGATDYSVEFRDMYEIVDGAFYSIPGGYVNIPQQYKSRDKDDNLVISKEFFSDNPDFFKEENGTLSTLGYSLNKRVIQPQSAMTIIENSTGAIKAMIGGRNITGRMLYNRATATRQPGSSIKPLAVYSAALQKSYELQQAGQKYVLTETGYDEQGTALWGDYITTASIVIDEPLTVNGRIWPKNSYNGYRGSYTFRTALQQSVNVCAVKILSQVGVDYAFDIAERFGLTTLVREGAVNDLNLAALGMGGLSYGVTTVEMASAYTTFVNDGIHKSYSCYTKVVNKKGEVILEPEHLETEALDPGVAWIMRDVLKTVVSEGIGSYARIPGAAVGGKTGTTSDSFDIWFDGFTANYSAALWIGNDVNIKLSSMSPMAARLWGKIMGQIDDALGGTYSDKPANVVTATIDLSSGMLATGESKGTRTEYFTKGTVPTESGSLYGTEIVCTESGYLATPACPETEEKTGTRFPFKVKGDDKQLPEYYCNLHNPDPEEYPADPDVKVTIVEIPNEDEEQPEEEPEKEEKPGKPEKPATDKPATDKPSTDKPATPPAEPEPQEPEPQEPEPQEPEQPPVDTPTEPETPPAEQPTENPEPAEE